MWVEVFVVLLTILLYWFYKNQWRYSSKLPPGPSPFPFIGNIPQMASKMRKVAPYEGFKTLSKIYGPIMGLHYGKTYQVIIHDPEIIREILCSETWVDRYFDAYVAERSYGKTLGIIFIGGDVWKEMRRFSMRTLRDFGFGKQKSMEASLEDEMSDFEKRLDQLVDEKKPISMRQFFTVPVLNVLWTMLAGARFTHDDRKLTELINLIDATSKANPVRGNIVMAFPFLRYILPNLTEKGRTRRHFVKQMHKYFNAILKERREEGVYKEEQRDFIDVFLKEIDNHKGDNPKTNMYTDEQFVMVSFDLFVAGAETTSNTLEFAMLYMILNPKVKTKVQAEIDQVVGRSRAPSLVDRSKMPYTEATLLEIQRMANVLPMIVRGNTEATKIQNYELPKGTIAVLNTHGMHMNPAIWDDPTTFKPERFLDASGTTIINSHNILPFGLGKRVCLGEVLAKATMFIYFTTLLQKYTWDVAPYSDKPSVEPVLGFTLSPEEYKVSVNYRQ